MAAVLVNGRTYAKSILVSKLLKYNINITNILTINNRSVATSITGQNSDYDFIVVGGGIVGMATAKEMQKRYPELRMAVVEKENRLAFHQSGHNSGVIHAGIYYKPGSLKAKLCVEGQKLMYNYCDEHSIPYKKVGKLIVATDKTEAERLDDLYKRGQENNVQDLEMIEPDKIKEIEPHCKGIKAIWSPHTGIVDYCQVTESYGKNFEDSHGDIYLNFKVIGFKEVKGSSPDTQDANKYPIQVIGEKSSLRASYVLTCAGLYADKMAQLSGGSRDPSIIPFRGEYLLLNSKKNHLVKGNIYPVPDPRYPFLGVHYTPRMDGSVWLGPNAVLAFKREGYKWTDFNLMELWDALKHPGFLKLAVKNLSYGSQEMLKSAFLQRQLKDLQKFVPEVTMADISRGPAGVRAQAVDSNGMLVDDFVFDSGSGGMNSRILHCRNAPSPGATSSLAIANMIADKATEAFKLGC